MVSNAGVDLLIYFHFDVSFDVFFRNSVIGKLWLTFK